MNEHSTFRAGFPEIAKASPGTEGLASAAPGTAKPVRSLTALIIAQDEEDCIARAVLSCRPFADEILVVDGGSRDGTADAAREAGARVLVNAWPGYARQRNFAAEHAGEDWVFFIDADEAVGSELAEAITAWKARPEADPLQAFAVTRMNNFFDTWWTKGERQVRLYNRRQHRIRNVLVHETPDATPDQIVQLPGRLWHFGFRSVGNLVMRFNRYTGLEAEKAYLGGRRFSLFRLMWRPPARFVQQYLVHRLCREGMAGFSASVLWVFYEVFTEIKLYELQWQARRTAPPQTPEALP
ncbi:Glycosyltransferase involved in cell wall bisynthesis [Faunimonas pinastri]|uniref:Glycosyltransferase involved in cell wall bisynthesis n=1 Tax=Faunimonas pinastri TaxID=1855383 RepID=A0A1H9PJI6_9HYPH|nr:glycosyltransferase family 2 protein [Faunimonas pinastri]SER47713.1 Glycosyltransferase involved in cell wall bisynthesis [Faunimonas pinastri]